MVHAGSGGSANNLSIEQYSRLIIKLNQACPELQCVLTAGPGEEGKAEQLAAELLAHGGNGWIYRSDEGLPKFCQVMANAALFVAGSTGPLHIAAAMAATRSARLSISISRRLATGPNGAASPMPAIPTWPRARKPMA